MKPNYETCDFRIKGDIGNDINLALTSVNVPLKLDRQNLILTQPLDKEGDLGPASITADVTCQRLGTSGLEHFYYEDIF